MGQSMNCQKSKNGEPCGKCRTCSEIAAGESVAVIEVPPNLATATNMRDLRRQLMAEPAGFAWQLVVFDRVDLVRSPVAREVIRTMLKTIPPETTFVLIAPAAGAAWL
ncbi:MAG: hypothetical protein M3Q23_13150 [Actinomycetota bacterium]|nr:hypothetical protein [Actinomycetota bacterium]